jgi:tetratricopeptide (TPR) repeat protein
VLMHSGDLKAAREKNGQQLRIEQQLGDKSGLAETEYDRGLLLEEQGDLSGARQSLQQSLATRTIIGENQTATEARAALAELSTHEGRYSEAETSARQVAEEFRKQGAATGEASALITVAESLLAQGKYSDAQKVVDRAGALLKQSQNRYATCIFAIAGARLRAASNSSQPNGTAIDEAEQQLTGIVKAAKKDGLRGLEFRARLALGEIQIKRGNVRSGRPRLAALERQASGTGFGLIAREAERARHENSKS